MQLANLVFLAFVLFLAFTIGLNLGLHGLLTKDSNPPIPTPTNTEVKTENASPVIISDNFHLINEKAAPAATQHVQSITSISSPAVIKSESSHVNSIESQIVSVTAASQTEEVVPTIDEIVSNIVYSESFVHAQSEFSERIKDSSPQHALIDYVNAHKSIPILLMTCNRAELLRNTLKSLLSVRGVEKKNILISQDGDDNDVYQVINDEGFEYTQNTEGLNLRGGIVPDGASRIAKHYKYSLSHAFDHFKDAPAIIVVEDDLLFSPDFLEYFTVVAPVLEIDSTLFLISAWNDNGFKGKVKDPFALKRTEFFPGLGWLLPRKLYKNELEANWPTEHWDHWLRSFDTHRGREIVYPEVPRSYHNGIRGTFMNEETHNRYFRDIDYNLNTSLQWTSQHHHGIPPYTQIANEIYELRVMKLLENCHHVNNMAELAAASGVVCMWINLNPDSYLNDFESIGRFFGIWHEHKRGAHKGLHEFYWQEKYIMLFNTYSIPHIESYKQHMPHDIQTIESHAFNMNTYTLHRSSANIKYDIFAATTTDASCDRVCREHGKRCNEAALPLVNTCEHLKQKFPCQSCMDSFGVDQPAYVNPSAEAEFSPGKCVVNTRPELATCGASHRVTMRLCACS